MGGLLAHELYSAFPKDIIPTLLFKNITRLDQYNHNGGELTVVKSDGTNISSHKLKLLGDCQPPMMDDQRVIIDNIVVLTKLGQTESALEPYIPHLSPKSNILLLQNGMGMAESLTERYWPSLHDRPNLFLAISTHGAYKTELSVVHHAARGELKIGYVPKGVEAFARKDPLPEAKDSLLQTKEVKESPLPPAKELPHFIELILQTEALQASFLPHDQFLLRQMEKLIVNACINPLTAVLDCLNGDLLHGDRIIPLMQRVVGEAIAVFFAEFKELGAIPSARSFLQEERLVQQVLLVCKLTSQNSSSMREDVKALNITEIDWINGYLVRLGKKHGVGTPTNRMLVSMVRNKVSIETAVERNAARLVIDS